MSQMAFYEIFCGIFVCILILLLFFFCLILVLPFKRFQPIWMRSRKLQTLPPTREVIYIQIHMSLVFFVFFKIYFATVYKMLCHIWFLKHICHCLAVPFQFSNLNIGFILGSFSWSIYYHCSITSFNCVCVLRDWAERHFDLFPLWSHSLWQENISLNKTNKFKEQFFLVRQPNQAYRYSTKSTVYRNNEWNWKEKKR